MKNIITFSAGLIFGIGLIISGMTNPAKVIGFLDLAGNWDPSLAFVMLGAITVAFFAFRQAKTRAITLLNEPMHLPATTHISKELIIGSTLFGAGWALAGFCPGPAIVALGAGYQQALIFVIAMLAGMMAHEHIYDK
nr:YeeE/YedE family protein [uncultured Methylotenera sp.]